MSARTETPLGAVLFDFDMTLVDSSYAIAHCMNGLAETFDLRPLTREEVLATIGLPIEEAWARLWGRYDPVWTEEYRNRFRGVEQTLLRPFPGTVPVLRSLRERGLRTGVVSNRRFARAVVQNQGLIPLTDVVVGLEDVDRPKPDPQSVLLALERLGVSPESSVYVGDTDIDMATASAAGVLGVGVTTGAFDEAGLLRAGADLVLGDLRDLEEALGLPLGETEAPRR